MKRRKCSRCNGTDPGCYVCQPSSPEETHHESSMHQRNQRRLKEANKNFRKSQEEIPKWNILIVGGPAKGRMLRITASLRDREPLEVAIRNPGYLPHGAIAPLSASYSKFAYELRLIRGVFKDTMIAVPPNWTEGDLYKELLACYQKHTTDGHDGTINPPLVKEVWVFFSRDTNEPVLVRQNKPSNLDNWPGGKWVKFRQDFE